MITRRRFVQAVTGIAAALAAPFRFRASAAASAPAYTGPVFRFTNVTPPGADVERWMVTYRQGQKILGARTVEITDHLLRASGASRSEVGAYRLLKASREIKMEVAYQADPERYRTDADYRNAARMIEGDELGQASTDVMPAKY